MNKKLFWLFTLLFLAAGTFADAQEPSKIPRIGFLLVGGFSDTSRTDAFRQGLRQLGYAEGKNIVIEWRRAERKIDRPRRACGVGAAVSQDSRSQAGYNAGIVDREDAPRIRTVASQVARGSARQSVNKSELEQFFTGIASRIGPAQRNSQGPSRPLVARPELEQFFSSLKHRVELAEKQQRRIDRRRATGFNVFHLIEPDENKLSDILADLLDPEGDHGQGDLFLRLLFKQLRLGSDAKLTKNVTVQREAPTHGILKYRRRMDVFVEARALLVIENKLDSLEQRDQVKDYLEHLRQCSRGREIRLIYLTPDGRPPESLQPSVIEQEQSIGKLHCWAYQNQLRVWLESCRRDCEAQKIRAFLSDFVAYIESALKRESENNQELEFE